MADFVARVVAEGKVRVALGEIACVECLGEQTARGDAVVLIDHALRGVELETHTVIAGCGTRWLACRLLGRLIGLVAGRVEE